MRRSFAFIARIDQKGMAFGKDPGTEEGRMKTKSSTDKKAQEPFEMGQVLRRAVDSFLCFAGFALLCSSTWASS